MFISEDIEAPINYYRASMRYKPKFSRGGKLEVPTLIIWGTEDSALSKQLAEESKNYISDCTLKFIEGASHWVQTEEPDKVNQYIHEFINAKKTE